MSLKSGLAKYVEICSYRCRFCEEVERLSNLTSTVEGNMPDGHIGLTYPCLLPFQIPALYVKYILWITWVREIVTSGFLAGLQLG
jgi:hypothetical protein